MGSGRDASWKADLPKARRYRRGCEARHSGERATRWLSPLRVRRLRALLNQRRVIFPRGLPRGPQVTFLCDTPRDESCHEGTVIPEQHQHTGVGFVQAVILRKPRLLGRFVAGFGYQRRSLFMPEDPSLSSNTSK